MNKEQIKKHIAVLVELRDKLKGEEAKFVDYIRAKLKTDALREREQELRKQG